MSEGHMCVECGRSPISVLTSYSNEGRCTRCNDHFLNHFKRKEQEDERVTQMVRGFLDVRELKQRGHVK